MHLLLINPNSSAMVTETLKAAVLPLQTDTLQIHVTQCANTPKGIVSSYDELKAGAAVVELLMQAQKNYDAAIIGCFADPGLRAARECIDKPVAGLYESSTIFAKLQGRRYSIIASGSEADISPWIGSVRNLGDTENLASIRYIGATVETAVTASDDTICRMIDHCKKRDGADAVILGCAAFAGRGKTLSSIMELPVIDGIEEAISIAKMLTAYRRTSSWIEN